MSTSSNGSSWLSKDSDQPAHSCQSSLSAWRRYGYFAIQWVHCEDFDQTARMCMLIWDFPGRTCNFIASSIYIDKLQNAQAGLSLCCAQCNLVGNAVTRLISVNHSRCALATKRKLLVENYFSKVKVCKLHPVKLRINKYCWTSDHTLCFKSVNPHQTRLF